MREAGKIVSETLQLIKDAAKPGVSTKELELIAVNQIKKYRYTRSAFKGYKGYPAYICASVDDTLVHGIPSDSIILKDGSLLAVDFAVS